jgi:hypothetical protein
MLGLGSIWWPFGAVTAVWFVTSVALGSIRAWKRVENMSATAQELGFTFTAWKGPESAPGFETPLFQKNQAGGLKNVMTGSYAGLEAQVFDYSYTSGSPGNSTLVGQTVAVYTHDSDFPVFALEPESLTGKIVDALQHQNVDIDCTSSFSRDYAVRGPEKERIRSLFNGRIISLIEGLDRAKGWHIEGAVKTLVLYRYRVRVKPAEMRGFLQETSSIAQSFFSFSAARAGSSRAASAPLP